jgi:hypothetical protein
MPVVFGEAVSTARDIVSVLKKHGDAVRGTYRARYRFDPQSGNPYGAPLLERPDCLKDNASTIVFPWEQIFAAAAICAGSDYPMLADHAGIDLRSVEFIVEGVFDPRDEFDGLDGFAAPADGRHCYLSLHLSAILNSSAPRAALERIHERVISRNMVLGALRGIPMTSELVVRQA